ncbi:MAG: hypothetical protein Q7R48_02305 [bacterium]|nr:hypothetical protein [bacterium]
MIIERKIIAVMGAASLSSLLFVIFVVVPQLQGITAEAAALEESRRSLDARTRAQASIAEFERFKRSRQGDIATLENLFVPQSSPISFIEFLEDTAIGLSSFKIVPGQVQTIKEDLWPSLSFRVSAQGPEAQVRRYVEKIEAAPFLIEITDLSLASLDQGGVSLSLSLKVYAK